MVTIVLTGKGSLVLDSGEATLETATGSKEGIGRVTYRLQTPGGNDTQ